MTHIVKSHGWGRAPRRAPAGLLWIASVAMCVAACVPDALRPTTTGGTGGGTGGSGTGGSGTGGSAAGIGGAGGGGRSPTGGMSGAAGDTGGGGGRVAGGTVDSGLTQSDAKMVDASASDAAPSDQAVSDGGDPLNAATRCSSGKTWTSGMTQNMRPGEACPTCHANFNLAGTVYPSGHEPDDCNGVDGISTGVTVVVTDATNRTITLYPNSVGNFYTSASLETPYTAKVVFNGKERAMGVMQTSQACNGCHTQSGSQGAPGRITLPL